MPRAPENPILNRATFLRILNNLVQILQKHYPERYPEMYGDDFKVTSLHEI